MRGLAPVAAAAGLWGRALAAGTILPATSATRAVTPSVMAATGSALTLRGECVFLLDVRGDRLVAIPTASHDVFGVTTWRYSVDVGGPSGNYTRHVPAGSVLHFRINTDSLQPWRGNSPLDLGKESSMVAAAVERMFKREASANHGYVIPAPIDGMDDNDLTDLRADLRTLQGRSTLVPGMQRGWSDSGVGPGTANWRSVRFGFDPTESQVRLRDQSAMEILASMGVPPELFSRDADGTGRREAWRQFLHGSVQPVADIIAEELTEKLETQVSINFDRLFASDVQGRARAFSSLTRQGEGLTVEAAARATGVDIGGS